MKEDRELETWKSIKRHLKWSGAKITLIRIKLVPTEVLVYGIHIENPVNKIHYWMFSDNTHYWH